MGLLKLQRGSSIQRAVAGMVMGLFGVLWLLMAIQLSAPFGWPIAAILGSMGVLITVWYWGQAAYHLTHAASQQRFAEDDHLPDMNPAPPVPVKRCIQCRAELDYGFRYCPQCGLKI